MKKVDTDSINSNLTEKEIIKSVLKNKNCLNCIFFTTSLVLINKKYCVKHYKNIKSPNSKVCNFFVDLKVGHGDAVIDVTKLAATDRKEMGKLLEIDENDNIIKNEYEELDKDKPSLKSIFKKKSPTILSKRDINKLIKAMTG